MNESQSPLLSVVVVIVSDTTNSRTNASHLASCLQALGQQIDAPPMEIIVPYHGNVSGIESMKAQYLNVVFIAVNDLKTYTAEGGSREHHDELRARGLAVARGEIIGLLEDHGRPDPHWSARMVEAHQQTCAAVGGAIENGIDRPLNWAVYFCDFGKYQNPLPAGESLFVSDANVSYKRSALESIRSTWQETFHETAVNWALTSCGEKLALSPKIIVYQNRGSLRLGNALKERFIWGRSYAATRATLAGGSKRAIYAALSPVLPLILLGRIAANVLKKRRCIGAFLKSLPLTVALTVSWSSGELTGYLTGRANRSRTAAGGTFAHASDG